MKALLKIFSIFLMFVAICSCKGKDESANYPSGNLDFVAPAGVNSGYDLTARTVAKVLSDTKIVKVPINIRNVTGKGGAVHLEAMQNIKGDTKTITVFSPPIIFINLNGTTQYSFRNLTPLANLIADYGAFVVRADSGYETINDVMEALKRNPKSVKIGGFSAEGSMDHIQFLIVARAAGVNNLNRIDYIPFDDNAANKLLEGNIDLFSTSLADTMGLIERGNLKILAQTADRRIGTGLKGEIPTCIEEGIDSTFIIWRGLFAAPDMPEYAFNYWTNVLAQMRNTQEWIETCAKYDWEEYYLNSYDFVRFLERTETEYKAIMQDINMLKQN